MFQQRAIAALHNMMHSAASFGKSRQRATGALIPLRR
jgi:hypothetical protein